MQCDSRKEWWGIPFVRRGKEREILRREPPKEKEKAKADEREAKARYNEQ